MADASHKSAGISPRRALLEELLEERSKAVAALPVDEQEPPSSAALWPLGIGRMTGKVRWGYDRRRAALELAVVAFAWLEQIDAELQAEAPGGVLRGEQELGE